jgi:hypothetical protein
VAQWHGHEWTDGARAVPGRCPSHSGSAPSTCGDQDPSKADPLQPTRACTVTLESLELERRVLSCRRCPHGADTINDNHDIMTFESNL